MNQGPGGILSTNHNGSHDRAFGSSLISPVRFPHPGLQLGLGGRWWDDHKVVKKLNLSPSQQQRMDSIFEANKPMLVTLYSNLLREQTRLASIPPAISRTKPGSLPQSTASPGPAAIWRRRTSTCFSRSASSSTHRNCNCSMSRSPGCTSQAKRPLRYSATVNLHVVTLL